jgi:aminobenzoyl-glutamate utilization protein B
MEFGTTCNILGAPGHSWQFVAASGSTIGHKSLTFAAKTMAGAAIDLITTPELIHKAKEEHRKRLGTNTYKPDTERRPPLELARASADKLTKKA